MQDVQAGQGWQCSKGWEIDSDGESICGGAGTGVQSGMRHAKDGTLIWSPWAMGLGVQQSWG